MKQMLMISERGEDELMAVRQWNQTSIKQDYNYSRPIHRNIHKIAGNLLISPTPNDPIYSILPTKDIINIPLQLQHLNQMGAMCVSKQEKLEQYNRKKEIEEQGRARKGELQNGIYAQKVRKYTQFYGRPVSDEMKKFIDENYSYNYNSEVRPAGCPRHGSLTITYKDRLLDRFETANKNGTYTRSLQFTKLQGNTIYYTFTTSNATYSCSAAFDSEDKFHRVYLNQQEKPYVYTPPPPVATLPKTNYYDEPQSNNYNGASKDWGAHYAAETARSNQQFRENMNRQAQEWNNYATQKANRGW